MRKPSGFARLVTLLTMLVALAGAQAAGPLPSDPAVAKRVEDLAQTLRCLVCQNQTIADSSAPLAVDLKNQIVEKIAQGQTNEQIVDYMVQRYGDFVLYRPPMKATTVLLWFGPAALLVLAIVVLFRHLARRSKQHPGDVPLSDAERRRAHALLGLTDKDIT